MVNFIGQMVHIIRDTGVRESNMEKENGRLLTRS